MAHFAMTTFYMEKKTGIFIRIGTTFILLLAIALVVVAVLSSSGRTTLEQTCPLPSSIEEDIPDENAIPESDPATEDYEIYVVQRGATLSVIAKAYSEAMGRTITVQDIKDTNNMKSDALTPGQELKIPKK